VSFLDRQKEVGVFSNNKKITWTAKQEKERNNYFWVISRILKSLFKIIQ
jgi:hypothetical protein